MKCKFIECYLRAVECIVYGLAGRVIRSFARNDVLQSNANNALLATSENNGTLCVRQFRAQFLRAEVIAIDSCTQPRMGNILNAKPKIFLNYVRHNDSIEGFWFIC